MWLHGLKDLTEHNVRAGHVAPQLVANFRSEVAQD
jgi:hypothetical protein